MARKEQQRHWAILSPWPYHQIPGDGWLASVMAWVCETRDLQWEPELWMLTCCLCCLSPRTQLLHQLRLAWTTKTNGEFAIETRAV